MIYKKFFDSLQIPLKETSRNFAAIFHAIALAFDSLQIYASNVLSLSFIQSRKDSEKHAKDRGIHKIKNEGNASYYERVLNAYSFNKNSSTFAGLTKILRMAVSKEFTIQEMYLTNWILGEERLGFVMNKGEKVYTTFLGADYISYYFVISFNSPLTLEEKLYLDELIDLYKPAHTGYHVDARIADDWKLDDIEQLGITTYIEG